MPVQGAQVNSIAYRAGKDAYDGPSTTDATGVAEIGFPVAAARNAYIVYIDVAIKAPDGQIYGATTYFRPAYPEG